MDSIKALYSEVYSCRQCAEFREHFKFAAKCHGKGYRKLMIVGESSHKPSIDAGRYYDNGSVRSLLMGVVDLDWDFYLSDAIKCDKQFCSAKGRLLDNVAKRCCSKFLLKEVNLLQPRAIIAVGRIAFEFLTMSTGNFTSRQNDGKRYLAIGTSIPVYPVIHPSYANVFYGRVPWQNVPYGYSFIQIVRGCLEFK